jgi:hypothetical protein
MTTTADHRRDEVRRKHAEAALRATESEACGCGSGSCCADGESVEVIVTHQVADGTHGAIVEAVKTIEPDKRSLPVVEAATKGGCC